MDAESLALLNTKRGATINGFFIEAYIFEGEVSTEQYGVFLHGCGVLLTFADGGSLWLHSTAYDGQSLDFTIDETLLPVPGQQTTIVDMGSQYGKNVFMEAEVGSDYYQMQGEKIEQIRLVRRTHRPFVVKGLLISTASQTLVFFIEADEGHLGIGDAAVAGLQQMGYGCTIEDF